MSMNNDNGTPWYLKFIYTFGIPATLTIYLVWFMVNSVDARLQLINATLTVHSTDMAVSLKASDDARQQLLLTNLLLQRICVNTASNQVARSNCFGPSQ
jgi:hypothetical protein